jgi:DNA-binding NarL/FixJ family response regulator
MPRRTVLSTRRPEGGLVVAGGDPGRRQRLLKRVAAAYQPRKVIGIGSGARLESHLAARIPAVVLFDLGAKPDAQTFSVISELSALAKTIVIAETDDESLAIQALKAGASGFCPRNTPPVLIRKAIQLVEAGEIWIGRRVMLRLIEDMANLRRGTRQEPASAGVLTERENAIAGLVARGAGNKEIARALSISIKTVKTHLTNMFRKVGISSRLQLALAIGPLKRTTT